MKIAIILGSARKGRESHKVAYFLESQLKRGNVQTDVIDLAEHQLPLLEDKTGASRGVELMVKDISIRLDQADGIILVSPEYHGSFSGVLKNALDYFWGEFQRKPVGVATVSAGRLGGINASTQLQHVILSLGAYPLPLKFLVAEVHKVFDESLTPVNEGITLSATGFLKEFLWFAEAIADKKRTELTILERV